MFRDPLQIRLLRALCFLLMVLAPLRSGPPEGFAETSRWALGPAQAVSQGSFSLGHASLSFTGQWAPIREGERTVGLFLSGSGTLTHASAFEPEWPIYKENLRTWTSAALEKREGARQATFAFQKARLLLAGAPFPTWAGEGAAPLEGPYQAFVQRWSKVEDHAPAHLLALQSANAPAKAVAVLEVESSAGRLLYRYDAADALQETLSVLHTQLGAPPHVKEWSLVAPLSRQYVGWDPRVGQPLPPFQWTALDVDLRTADNRQAELVVEGTLNPFEDGLRVLPFNLLSEVMTPKDVRHLRISRITDGAGTALVFAHDHDRLAVQLSAPTQKGVPVKLRFEYGGDFLVQPNADSYWELGVSEGWYPTPESEARESYLFHALVRTKGDWIAFLPGETLRREKEGAWNLVETRTTRPICFATILGGRYSIDEEIREGRTVRIATYGSGPGVASRVLKDQAFNVMAYYEKFLGPFPFKEFSVVEKNEWGYGQAPPGMMYITKDAFEQVKTGAQWQELANEATLYGIEFSVQTMDVRQVFAHEIAHQYWGTVVKMPSSTEQWITESFADYCAGLYLRDYKGQAYFEKELAHWSGDARRSQAKGPIPLANDVHPKDSREAFLGRRDLLYAKGPALLAALHKDLGDQVFFTWLKAIQRNFQWNFASTRRLFELLAFITKKDYTAFYKNYYWGLDLPPAKP